MRHALPAVEPGVDYGAAGPSLSEEGRRQAEAVGRQIALDYASGAITAVLTSPIARARETAELVAASLGADGIELVEELRGRGEVELRAGIAADVAHLVEAGERAWPLIESLQEAHPPDAVVIAVSHEVTIRALVCRAIAIAPEHALRFALEPASLTTIEFRTQPQRRTILGPLNETCHLDGL